MTEVYSKVTNQPMATSQDMRSGILNVEGKVLTDIRIAADGSSSK